MDHHEGIIIEESLENTSVLKRVKILSTQVEPITDDHQTPWLTQWTIHTVEVAEDDVKEIAEEIRQSLDRAHSGSWYADFKNTTHHIVIFPEKVFIIDRTVQAEYDEVRQYGISLGIPAPQMDFQPGD